MLPDRITSLWKRIGTSMKYLHLLIAISASAAGGLEGAPVPDFSLPEVNTLSTRYRATTAPVSPGNYLHQVTGWYFGHET
jgi:hypothetical protein